MTATINQCLGQLAADLTAALTPATADKVYGFRVLPNKLPTAVSLTYIGGLPQAAVTGGAGAFYDFAAVLVAQHDNTESGLLAAEQVLNAVENIVFDTLSPSRNTLWRKVEFLRPSVRPPTPEELMGARYGEIYFRLHMR